MNAPGAIASTAVPVWGAPEGWDAFLLARRRAEFAGPVLHVTRDDARMARLTEALAFFAPEIEVLRFPAWDCLPYDRVSPNPALVSERIATLARLLETSKRPRIVLTTVNALVQRVPPSAVFANASLELKTGGDVKPERLAQFLEANGYGRAGTVMEPGEYAMRGGIVDIFPAGEADPIRLDMFGDTIETIKTFGSLINTLICTTRKFFNILISVIWNANPLLSGQWVAVCMVFVGLIASSLSKSGGKSHHGKSKQH